jgi:hypothetical protein
MEAVSFSETFVILYRTTRRNITEGSIIFVEEFVLRYGKLIKIISCVSKIHIKRFVLEIVGNEFFVRVSFP